LRAGMPETLIVRLPNWLGDTVMAVPTIRALGKARRQAKLVLAGPWSGLFVDQDLADVLVAYPRAWIGRLRSADTVRALAPGAAAGPRIGVHLGAAFGPSKIWPIQRIVEFCGLARGENVVPVLMGAPDDEPLARAVMEQIDVANLVGRDRPDLLTGLLSELDV